MITLEDERLEFHFPEVHDAARFSVRFMRTLRIPDDGRDYPLPPGLGALPLHHLDDFAERVPVAWRERGGVIMPMHQAEAMWISFDSSDYPIAVKIAAGKVNAVSGEAWLAPLHRDPQDYIVLPDQPWLDGFCVEKGIIRQFVAMPLGQGYTVEEQLAKTADVGGVQIIAYPMKRGRYEAMMRERPVVHADACYMASPPSMGLAPGGRMRQEVYADRNAFDAWDLRHPRRCFVSIVNSAVWRAITGEAPPHRPPTAADYSEAGLPWFEYYSEGIATVPGSDALAGALSVAKLGQQKGEAPLPENDSAPAAHIVRLGKKPQRSNHIREGSAF